MERLAALTSLDGVAAFVGTSTKPKLTAGLVVRVGMCDEDLPVRGISHLVEHLTLSKMPRRLTAWNGFVDQHTTNFVVHGRPDEVLEYFTVLNDTLLDPPYDRIPTEAQILRTESAGPLSKDPFTIGLRMRIGARNYGARWYPEYGLEHPDPALVHRWLTTHYRTDNAAFWCTGPVPDGLRLSLPAGPATPAPVPTWLDEVYPAYTSGSEGRVSVTIIGEWSTNLLVTLQVVRDRLFQVLRLERGLSYTVDCQIESLCCGRLLHASISADGLAENLATVRDIMSSELSRLAWDGPTSEDLATFVDGFRRAASDNDDEDEEPVAAQARCHLFGTPYEGRDVMLSVAEQQTPAGIAAVLAGVLPSALWMVPDSVGWCDRRVVAIRPWSTQVVAGTPVPILAPQAPDDRRSLVLAHDGVTMQYGEEQHPATVHFDRTAALLAYTDGSRVLIGDDGFHIPIDPALWPDATDLVRFVDSRVPSNRIVYIPDRDRQER